MVGDEQIFAREAILGAEQSVLGSMLIDPRTVGLVVEELSEDDFRMELNREIFRAIRGLFLAEKPIDPVTVLHQIGDEPALRQYLLQLMDITPTAANVREHIALTRKGAQLARLQAIGEQLKNLTDPEDGLHLLKAGADLLSQEGRDDEADMEKSILDFYSDLERKPNYLAWGFPFLDEGLFAEQQDFVILAGRPSDGKTALALHMAYTQAKTLRVGFFSLETGRKRLFSRLVSSVSGVTSAAIKRRNLNDTEYALIASGAETMSGRNLSVIEAAGWTVEQIEARAMARQFDVIYIDYLQLIHTSDRRWRGSRNDEVADISRALANMARRHGIAVVALSQLSRPEQKGGKRREPILADLRESGQIEQDADVAMFIWRKEENKSNAERFITVAKNKEGQLGTWPVVFRGELQRFLPDQSGYKPELPRAKPRVLPPREKQVSFNDLPGGFPTPFGRTE